MTLLLDAEARLFAVPEEVAAEPARERQPAPATWVEVSEPGATLDDLLSETWEGLTSASSLATCPVCDGELVRRWSAGAGVVGGRCRDCGSELS
jgi:hypothetical protein